MNQYSRPVVRSVGVLLFYAASLLMDGLIFHQPYHQNTLVAVISMVVFIASAPLTWWWTTLPACFLLALTEVLLAWGASQVIVLDGPGRSRSSFAKASSQAWLAG